MQTQGKPAPAAVGNNQLQPPERHRTLPTAVRPHCPSWARARHVLGVTRCGRGLPSRGDGVHRCVTTCLHRGGDGWGSVFLTRRQKGLHGPVQEVMPGGVTAHAVPLVRSSGAVPSVVVSPWCSTPVWAGGALSPPFLGWKEVVRDRLVHALLFIRWVAASGFDVPSVSPSPAHVPRGKAWRGGSRPLYLQGGSALLCFFCFVCFGFWGFVELVKKLLQVVFFSSWDLTPCSAWRRWQTVYGSLPL